MIWIGYALGAAFFAGLTAILAKAGLQGIPSSLATALRTVVVLVTAVAMVLVVGSGPTIVTLNGRTWLFLLLSGLATGASWLCFFRALQLGPVAKVAVVDRSSIIITVLFAVLFLGETDSLTSTLIGVALIGLGTFLMIDRVEGVESTERRTWLLYAAAASVFAALSSILGKVGIEGVESTLGTAIRTVVVLVMAWLVVAVKREGPALRSVTGRELTFLTLSGLATGASWLCFWRAMQDGPASIVASIDKLSIVVTVALAAILFKEKQSRVALFGLGLISVGTLVMIVGAT